jgi:cell division protein FtsZ
MEEINTAISLGIQIVLEVLMRSSLINLDFADFTTVVKNGGRALFSFASFDGEKRDEKAVKEILKMSLQPQTSLKKIQKSILFVRGGVDMKREELKNVMTSVQKRLADDALVILGVAMRDGKQSLDIVFLGTVGSKEEKS